MKIFPGMTIPCSVICSYDKVLQTHSAQQGLVVIEWSLTAHRQRLLKHSLHPRRL